MLLSSFRPQLCLLSLTLHTQLSRAQAQPAPGSTVELLFVNTTRRDLTAYVERWQPTAQTTYLINCVDPNAAECDIHDATLSVVEGKTYDFHTAINSGGALTIHCGFEEDGRTPTGCTRTIAGGPEGIDVSISDPTEDEWEYLPVTITDQQTGEEYQFTGTGGTPTATDVFIENPGPTQTGEPQPSESRDSQDADEEEEEGDDTNDGRKVSVYGVALVVLALMQPLFFLA